MAHASIAPLLKFLGYYVHKTDVQQFHSNSKILTLPAAHNCLGAELKTSFSLEK